MSLYQLWAYAIFGVLMGATYFIDHPWVYSPNLWLAMVGGFFAVVGGVPYIMSMSKAPGSVIQPLMGMVYPLIAISGLIFLGEPITAKTVCGIICAAVSLFFFV